MNTRPKTFSMVLVLASVLTLALCISAYLQYQWLNQLSAAEEVRIRSSVENAAHQLGDEVNAEMMRAIFAFVVPVPENLDDLAERLSERWIEWYATSRYEGLVKNVYWMEYEAPGESGLLLRFNQNRQAWERVSHEMPIHNASYKDLERHFETDIVFPVPFSRGLPSALPPFPFDPGAAVMQDQLFIVFDASYISAIWLPDLVSRFFQNHGEVEYDILITAREEAEAIVFSSREGIDMPQDVDVQIHIGPPDAGHMMRLIARVMSRPPAIGGELPRLAMGGGRAFTGGAAPLRLWTLYINHQSGALETAVTHVRHRNIGVSFLVLLVLGISVGLIVLYTRRIQHVADQQMAFVAGVSHDIKTPIAVMHAVGENMRDGLVVDPDETREYGTFVVDQSRSLLNTVDQVLSYAGITMGARPYVDQALDLNRVVQLTLSRMETDLEEVNLDLNLDATLPPIRGDEEALVSVVQNLMQNAVKYGGDTSCIRLKTYKGRGQLHLIVEDEGRGIAIEDQPHIFEPFYRAATVRASQIRGNGLGLSIVKNIVEAHNGSITFKSAPQKGTTFYVSLPE